jgi:hypothetical protein
MAQQGVFDDDRQPDLSNITGESEPAKEDTEPKGNGHGLMCYHWKGSRGGRRRGKESGPSEDREINAAVDDPATIEQYQSQT